MQDMIRTLEQRGFAYVASGNVYFDVRAFPGYGAMANLDLGVEAKARRSGCREARSA